MQYINNTSVYQQDITYDPGKDKNLLNREIKLFVFVVAIIFSFLWFCSDPDVLYFHKLLSMIIAAFLFVPFYLWIRSDNKKIPFFELVSFHYFVIFCIPVFLGPVKYVGATQFSIIAEDNLTHLLFIVFLGMICLFIGFYAVRLPVITRLPAFHIDEYRGAKLFLIYLAIAIAGPIFFPSSSTMMRKIGSIIFNINGYVSIYALAIFMYSGKLTIQQRTLFFTELLIFVMLCIASGWLEQVVYPILSLLIAEVKIRNRLPIKKVVFAIIIIIALNASKGAFREKYWEGKMGGTGSSNITDAFKKATDWIDSSPTELDSLADAGKEFLTVRTNQLGFVGHVVRVTPKFIPYLYGESYKTIPAMLVPRIIWRDKPATMDMINDISLRYGWLTEELLGQVAVNPGLMEEGYMNFGIIGIVIVMLIFGAFIRWLTDTLSNHEKGFAWELTLIGFIFGGGLIGVTYIAQSYLGGLWQTIIAIAVLYLPVRLKLMETEN